MDLATARSYLEEHTVHTVLLQFTDIGGHLKGVGIPTERFGAVCAQGQWIDGSSLDGAIRLRENDMLLQPDLATLSVLPWQDDSGRMARVICDVTTTTNKPFPGDPRHVLHRVTELALAHGYKFVVAPEIEFFICERGSDGCLQTVEKDRNSYFDLSADAGANLRHAIVAALGSMGIVVESSHHEVATGQHEIDLAPLPAVGVADALVTLKFVARRLARQHNLAITFMPKPFNGMSGSGLHLHQILMQADGTQNLFARTEQRGLTTLGEHFIAGQLYHAGAMMALLAPLVNSYKRLVGGYEAPATVGWAYENRSALIRVPMSPHGGARVEMRGSDPACNPYLALAALLRAGLVGIDERLVAPQPVEEPVLPFEEHERMSLNSTPLPLSLGEALQALGASRLLQETLGEHVFGRFMEMKRREWRDYRTYVTDWEQSTYADFV